METWVVSTFGYCGYCCNEHGYVSLFESLFSFSSFWYIPRNGITGSYDHSVFVFVFLELPNCFPCSCTISQPGRPYVRAVSLHLCQYLLFEVVLLTMRQPSPVIPVNIQASWLKADSILSGEELVKGRGESGRDGH